MKSYFIWGMGLLGTSLALDLRKMGHAVGGAVRSSKNREVLARLSFENIFLNTQKKEISQYIQQCDGVIIGTPVEAIPGILDFLAAAKVTAWVTDMASTKSFIMQESIRSMRPLKFIGSHPMAGSDLSGPEHAIEKLFSKATIYVTPAAELSEMFPEGDYRKAETAVMEFWNSLGGFPYLVDYRDHDKWAAYLSHGLHLVACMVSHLLKDIPEVFQVPSNPAGGSFRDITRVAGANPSLWNGIITSNQKEVTDYLKNISTLAGVWHQKMTSEELSIEKIFMEANDIRERIIKTEEK